MFAVKFIIMLIQSQPEKCKWENQRLYWGILDENAVNVSMWQEQNNN